MNVAQLLSRLTDEQLAAFARYEQGRADELQSKARRAQKEADMARKMLKRRKREARA